MRSSRTQSVSVWAALIAVYIIWGSTYLAIRFAVETLPPFLLASARFLTAGGILYAFRRLRGDPVPTREEWKSAVIIGGLLLLGANGWVSWAEQRVNSSIAALMVATVPLWMATIEAVRPGGKRPTLVTWAGVLIGIIGLVVLINPLQMGGDKVDLLGAGVLAGASLLWALGSLFSRGAKLPASPLMGTGMEMLAGGAGLLILGTLVGEWSQLDPAAVSSKSVLSLGYLIVFGSLVGFGSYTWLLRNAPTALVSTYAYVNPLVALALGNLLANEPLSPRMLIAAGIIISSVVLLTRPQSISSKLGKEKGVPQPAGDD